MHIIKITSTKCGSGKSEALQALADRSEALVIPAAKLVASLPLLMLKVSALDKNTFVDDVTDVDLDKFKKLARLYPDTYHLYLAGNNL